VDPSSVVLTCGMSDPSCPILTSHPFFLCASLCRLSQSPLSEILLLWDEDTKRLRGGVNPLLTVDGLHRQQGLVVGSVSGHRTMEREVCNSIQTAVNNMGKKKLSGC